MRELRNKFRFIPFGKFSLSGRGRPPFNQVLVGRQKERANFIEMLTHQERFGAFLVSGQRGAGKTSFVEYCLSEYDRMAFQRSIRISRNAPFLSYLFLVIFAVVATALFVLGTQAMELFAQNALETLIAVYDDEIKSVHNPASLVVIWTWLPLVGLSFLMIWPFLFAMRTVSAISELGDTPIERSVIAVFVSAAIIIAPFLLVAGNPLLDRLCPSSGPGLLSEICPKDPVFGMSEALLLLAWWMIPMTVLGHLVQSASKNPRLSYNFARRWTMGIVPLSAITAIWGAASFVRDPSGTVGLEGFFPVLASFGLLVALAKAASRWMGSQRNTIVSIFWLGVAALIVRICVPFGGVRTTTDGFLGWWPHDWNFQPLLPALVYMFLFACSGYWVDRKFSGDNEEDNAVPFGMVKAVLLTKANLLTLLTVLGLLPLARVLFAWVELGSANMQPGFFLGSLPTLVETHLELGSFVTIVLLLVVLYWCEYEWICRDQRSYRQDSSIGLLGRARDHPTKRESWPPLEFEPKRAGVSIMFWAIINGLRLRPSEHDQFRPSQKSEGEILPRFQTQSRGNFGNPLEPPTPTGASVENSSTGSSDENVDHHERHLSSQLWTRRRFVARKMEHATLPNWVYSVRFPVMPIWVNLGFDNLEHSRIVESMLRRLRSEYRSRFISPGSAVGLMNASIILTCAVILTSVLSKSLFHVGNLNDFDRHYAFRFESSDGMAREVFGQTDYCAFFEVYPEIAPNMKSVICALPYSNAIMELLYAPMLQVHVDFRSLVSPYARSTYQSEDVPLAYQDWSGVLGDLDPVYHEAFVGNFPTVHNDLGCVTDIGPHPPTSPKLACLAVPRKNTKHYAVGQSQLIRFVMDQNFGLPKLDFAPAAEDRFPGMATYRTAFSPYGKEYSKDGPPTLRTYHILMYLLLFWMFAALNRRFAILPYRANLDSINELILLINGRETMRSGDRAPSGGLAGLIPFKSRERVVEIANDPRVVEQRFLQLLHRLRPYQTSFVRRMTNPLEIRPEITFVFDEMDKLSGIVDPEFSREAERETRVEENNRERARSRQLHQLLSDMKRLISGNSARYIFIGGRLYHDEWLADQAQRSPILNSIFNGQIYLPSLMADRRHPYGRFNDRIAELVILMYRNSRHRLANWAGQRKLGPFSGTSQSEEPTYVQFEMPYSGHPRRLAALCHHVGMRVVDELGNPYSIKEGAQTTQATHSQASMSLGEQETLDQFMNFLTYRSAGNPKKLKELLQNYVQPSSYALSLPRYPYGPQHRARWERFRRQGHDVIALDDKAIYRVQFIDMLYRHLSDHFEGRMLERDDKVSISIFYLMDFLMKFHNRGFSRTNLQRVDELSHIHRAPDLRSVMGDLLQVSSERFLHRVLNGVYTFRFRSDFAREIDYLSRISKEEMAALNFTLDESQSLKGLYQQTITTGERENIDTIAGLGELYEYDQEFEIARNYYRRAISQLDRVQSQVVMSRALRRKQKEGRSKAIFSAPPLVSQGQVAWPAPDSELGHVELHMLGDLMTLEDEQDIRNIMGAQVHWAIARLRLMLQVGHTYEQEQNFERAGATYMHAQKFSEKILNAFCDSSDVDEIFDRSEPLRPLFLRTASIFYQAGLSAAWVKEKDPESVDESVLYAEHWLQGIYRRETMLVSPLPGIDGYGRTQGTDGSILIQTALNHDRLGDLYFMKGRQSMRAIKISDIAVMADENTSPDNLGYLGKAQEHYAAALWMLRKYMTHRYRISGKSWSAPMEDMEEFPPKFRQQGVQPLHFHITAADVLTDLSEVIFAGRNSLSFAKHLMIEPVGAGTGAGFPVRFASIELYRVFLRRLLNETVDALNERFVVELKEVPATGGQPEPVCAKVWQVWKKPGANVFEHRDKIFDEHALPNSVLSIRDELRSKHAALFASLPHLVPDAGHYEHWLGKRSNKKPNRKKLPSLSSIAFERGATPVQRVYAYRLFAHAAARSNQKIGKQINTANEYLLQAEGMIATLWSLRTVRWVRTLDAPNPSDGVGKARSAQLFEALDIGKDAKPDDQECFKIGLMALNAILDAIERIQFSERPSSIRMALNHGNPAWEQEVTGKISDPAKKEIAQEELQTDYDLAQAFRDDPRGITQACSLVLALLEHDTGPLCTALAVKVYQDVLYRYAKETFHYAANAKGGNAPFYPVIDWVMKNVDKGEDLRLTNSESLRALRQEMFQLVFNGLQITLERFRFPILNRLNGLKTLADSLIMHPVTGDALIDVDAFEKRIGGSIGSQVGRLVRELLATAEVYGSDQHFPPHKAGTTLAAAFLYMRAHGHHVLYDDMTSDGFGNDAGAYFSRGGIEEMEVQAHLRPKLSDAIMTREAVGEQAIAWLNRSQESFSMGDAYYENISHMQFLNDDFNDRSMHFNHACAMAHGDLSEVLALIVKEGIRVTKPWER